MSYIGVVPATTAGNNTELQYNNNGVMGSSSNLTFDGTRLDVTGEVRASTGILFGTDTAAVNTLNDYEEGTFTPTLGDTGSTTFTYSLQTGIYTIVGNKVFFYFSVGATHNNNSPGSLQIAGFPFPQANNEEYPRFATTINKRTDPANSSHLAAYLNPNGTVGNILQGFGNGTTWSQVQTSELTAAGFDITFSGFYTVA